MKAMEVFIDQRVPGLLIHLPCILQLCSSEGEIARVIQLEADDDIRLEETNE